MWARIIRENLILKFEQICCKTKENIVQHGSTHPMLFSWFAVTKCSITDGSVEKRARTWTEFSSAEPSSAEDRPMDAPSLSEGEDAKDKCMDGKCAESASGSLSGSK
jgi:hypothetical protein